MPESAVAAPPPAQAAPAPSPAPSAPPPQQAGEPLNDAFSDLDQMLSEPEPPKSSPKEKAAEKQDRQDKQTDESPEQKQDKAAPEPGKMAPKQLREAYEALKAKHAAIENEYNEFKKTASQPKDDPEKKEFYERAERYSKHAQDLENELKFAKYEKSEEYQERYYKPYEQAFGMGRAKAAGLKMTDENGNVRQGTPEDFDTYMFISDDDTAAEYAEKVFGKHKTAMEYHRERVRELGAKSQTAVEDYRKKGSDREKEWTENQTRAQQAMGEYWSKLNSTALEKYPQLFKASDEDKRGQELLSKGFGMADRAFGDGRPSKDGDKPLNPAELIALRSAIRNKAAGFDYQVYLKNQAMAKVKQLESELAEYSKSEPRAGDGRGSAAPVDDSNWESQLEQMAV